MEKICLDIPWSVLCMKAKRFWESASTPAAWAARDFFAKRAIRRVRTSSTSIWSWRILNLRSRRWWCLGISSSRTSGSRSKSPIRESPSSLVLLFNNLSPPHLKPTRSARTSSRTGTRGTTLSSRRSCRARKLRRYSTSRYRTSYQACSTSAWSRIKKPTARIFSKTSVSASK